MILVSRARISIRLAHRHSCGAASHEEGWLMDRNRGHRKSVGRLAGPRLRSNRTQLDKRPSCAVVFSCRPLGAAHLCCAICMAARSSSRLANKLSRSALNYKEAGVIRVLCPIGSAPDMSSPRESPPLSLVPVAFACQRLASVSGC